MFEIPSALMVLDRTGEFGEVDEDRPSSDGLPLLTIDNAPITATDCMPARRVRD